MTEGKKLKLALNVCCKWLISRGNLYPDNHKLTGFFFLDGAYIKSNISFGEVGESLLVVVHFVKKRSS